MKKREKPHSWVLIVYENKKFAQYGEVVQVGGGARLNDTWPHRNIPLKTGDIVLFPEWAYKTVEIDSEKYLLTNYQNTIAQRDWENLVALNNAVILRQDKKETTKSGIIVPKQGQPDKGEVLGVGGGRLRMDGECHQPQVDVGDTLYFERGTANITDITWEELLLVIEPYFLAKSQNVDKEK